MKIAIISDTHDNLPNLEKCLAWCRQQETKILVHCGDIACADTVEFMAAKFFGDMHLVYGNMDFGRRDEIYIACDNLPACRLHGDEGEIFLTDENDKRIKIAFCHFPEDAKRLAGTGKFNLVFYGHTHRPWMETLPNNCQMINPGTLGGLFNKATFAMYDTVTGKLELKILESI